MDRRQRKTRKAIFDGFIALLSEHSYDRISVEQIIQRADIGRATFYAHFETKDHLLKALCEALFAHIFAAETGEETNGSGLFECDAPGPAFLHLFRHLQRNDNHILQLLSCRNNELFLGYFRTELVRLVREQRNLFAHRKAETLPESFWLHHIASTFTETLRWWVENGMQETPEQINQYFLLAV